MAKQLNKSHSGGNQINYSIGFNTDKTTLNELKTSLVEIQKMTSSELMDLNKGMNVDEANAQLKEMRSMATSLRQALNNSFNKDLGTTNVTKFNSELSKTGYTLKSIADTFYAAGEKGKTAFRNLTTEALTSERQIKKNHSLIQDMANTMANTVKWGIASSAMNNFTGSVQKAYSFVKQLDTSLNNIMIVTNKSSDEMAKFAKQANDAAKALGAQTTTYTDAALIYYQQGLGEEETKARAETTVKAANVTGQTGDQVSEELTAVWNGYKVSAEETELYVDKLAKVAAGTAADLEELSTGMSKVASAANTAGVDVDQLNATLATVISVTREAPETIGTAFKTIYARMGDLQLDGTDEYGVSLGTVSGQLHELGIELLDEQGNMRDMGDVIEDTAAKWDTWTNAQKQAAAVAMAGKMQYSRLMSLFENWDMYEDALNMSKDSVGELQKEQDIYMQSTEAHLQKMRASFEGLYSSLLDADTINGFSDAISFAVQRVTDLVDGLGGGAGVLLNLGSIATRVFSKQIAQSIYISLENVKGLIAGFQNLKTETELIDIVKGLNLDDENLKQIIALKEAFGEYTDFFTEQEQNQAGLLIKATNEILNQKEAWKENLEAAKQYYTNATGKEFNEGELETKVKKGQENELTEQAAELDKLSKSYLTVSNVAEKADDQINNFLISLKKNKKETGDVQKEYNKLSSSLKEIVKQTNKYMDTSGGASKYANELQDLKELQDAIFGDSDSLSYENIDNLESALHDYVEKAKQLYKQMGDEAKNTSETVQENAKGMSRDLEQSSQNLENTKDKMLNEAKTKKQIAAIAEMVGSIGQLSTAFTSLTSLDEILFSDDTYSDGEKTLKLIETLSFTLPMVASGFSGIKKNAASAFMPLAEQLGAVQVAETAAGTQATIMWSEILWPVALVVAALASVGVGIYALVKAYNADADAAKEAAEEANHLTNNYNELNEAATTLKDTISDYSEAVKQLDSLTEGTDEYTSALEKANEKAKELIETYGLYDKYTTKNGLITIDEATLQEAQNTANSKTQRAETEMYSAKIAANQASLKSNNTNLRRAIGSTVGTGQYSEYGSEYTRQFDKDEIDAVANALNSLEIDVTQSDEALKKELLSRAEIPQTVKDNIDAIVDNKEKLKEYANSIEEATKANKYYTQQITENIVEDKYGTKINQLATETDEEGNSKVNESRAKQIQSILSQADESTTEEMQKALEKIDVSNITSNRKLRNKYSEYKDIDDDEALAREYAKRILNKSEEEVAKMTYKRGWNKGTLKDETGKNVIEDLSDDTMRKSLARNAESTKVKDKYTNKIDNQGLLTSIENIMSGAKSMGEKYGTDFTDALLNAMNNKGKIDFSDIFADINPNEFLELYNMDPKDLQEALGLSDEDLKNLGAKGADLAADFKKNFINGFEGYEWNIDDAISNSIDKNSSELEKNDIDEEEIRDYSKQIMEMADQDEKLADSLEQDADAALDVAEYIMLMNDGIDELAENWEDWEDILKKSSKTSEEYAEALGGIKASLSKVLGVEEDAISSTFVEDHLEQIKKAANGDADAIDNLRSALTDDILANVVVDNGLDDAKVKDITDKYNQIKQSLQDVKIGTQLTGKDQLVKDLQDVIKTSGMTQKQANAFLQGIGFKAKFKKEKKSVTQNVPGEYTVTPKIVWNKHKGTAFGKKYDFSLPTIGASVKAKTKKVKGDMDVASLTTDGSDPVIESLERVGGEGSGAYNNYSSANPGGPAPGGKSGGSDPATKDLNDDQADPYEKVNVQLEKIEANLKKIQSQEDKLMGQKLVDNLNQQLGVLNQKIEKTNEKLKIAQREQSKLQGTLSSYGIGFDSEGVMTNYAEVFDRQQAALNAVYNHYNSLSADAQKGYEATVTAAEKRWEKFKDAVSDYDTLIGSTIPGLEQDIQDTMDEKLEIQIKEFDMSIDLTLDIKDAQDKWNDFKKKIIKDLKDTDILGNALDDLERFADYYNEQGLGVIQQEVDHLNKLMGEVDKYNNTGWSTVYGDDQSSMMEDLKKYYEQAMDDLESVKDLIDDIHDKMNETLEDIADQMDDQMNYYEAINDTLDHDMQLVQLVYGEEAYDRLALYYEQMEKNLNGQLEFQKASVDFWQAQMDSLEEGSEEWKTAKENWLSAVKDWQSSVETAIENLSDKYLNTINEIFQSLNNKVTKGNGLDYINTEWELIKKNADEYLDTINTAYGIQQLQNKYLDAIDSTKSVTAQQKLNKLMKEQIDALKQQDKLTQYDLDRAELKYQIAVKRIALEEAQQNKSTMRLRRDSQGNYSYQYVADEDQVSKAQQEISDLYNQLYNLDVDQYQSNLDKVYEIWTEYQEKMKEAAQINDAEARLKKEQLLTEQYGQLINGLVSQNETIKQGLYESTFLELEDLYGKQSETVENFLQNQDDMMSLLITGWSSGLQEMADEIKKEGGFEATYEETLEKIKESTQEYEDELKNLQDIANVSFDSLGKDVDDVQNKIQSLTGDTNTLINKFAQEVQSIQDVMNQIDALNDMYQRQSNAIQTVVDAYNKYIQAMNNARNAATQASNSVSGNGGSGSSGSSSGGSSGSSNPYAGYPLGGQTYTVVKGDNLWNIAKKKYGNASQWPTIYNNNRSVIGGNPNKIYPGQVLRLDTGGYTGAWGTEGRMAMLHEKELVLNKKDTENMLNAVEILRNITSTLDINMLARLASLSANSYKGIGESSPLQQEVHIDATFPNVSNHNEIEDALNNLVNAAAQRVGKKR